MIKLSIQSAVRRIRLSQLQSPLETVISDRSPSWRLLAKALEGSLLVMTGVLRKIIVGPTRSTQIGDTNPDAMHDPPQVNSPPCAGGNGTGAQAPTTEGNQADGRASVNSPVPTPPQVRNQVGPSGRSRDNSTHRTPTTSGNLPRTSATIQNLQRVRDILNNPDPTLAGTPGNV